jgi:hypothetical protein
LSCVGLDELIWLDIGIMSDPSVAAAWKTLIEEYESNLTGQVDRDKMELIGGGAFGGVYKVSGSMKRLRLEVSVLR